jgi:hypothetical protein
MAVAHRLAAGLSLIAFFHIARGEELTRPEKVTSLI